MAYREDPLWVSLGPHVGVMNLLQDHPSLVMFTVLPKITTTTTTTTIKNIDKYIII